MSKKKINYSNLVLEDLWTDAIFNNSSYELLEEFVKNNEDLSVVKEKAMEILTTTRNRNLISATNQEKLKNTVVSFFGLSVGSHAALSWIMESRANKIFIADPDIITPTNLNRLRFGQKSIGKLKTDIVQKSILEMSPSSKVFKTTEKGKGSIKKIFNTYSINFIVDAIDDLEGKIFLRKIAKQKKLPLISATDVGDNVFLDIERYDLHPAPQLFLGRISNPESLNVESLSETERIQLIIKIVGLEENSEEMLDSLLSIGKNISTWPQLGATATIAGGIIATTIKKIVLGEKLLSGRYYFSLDNILVSNFNSNFKENGRNIKVKSIYEKFQIK